MAEKWQSQGGLLVGSRHNDIPYLRVYYYVYRAHNTAKGRTTMGEALFWIGFVLILTSSSVRLWKRADKIGLPPELVRGALIVFLVFTIIIVIDVVNNHQP